MIGRHNGGVLSEGSPLHADSPVDFSTLHLKWGRV